MSDTQEWARASEVEGLMAALREAGHTVEATVTGSVRVDGEECDGFAAQAIAWDGTQDGLEDLGW